MTQRRLAIATIVIIAIIIVVAIVWYVVRPSRQLQNASQAPIVGKAQVGQTAPEFQVATTQGLFDLDKTGKPVFLEVFATWCPHCQREVATIDRLYNAYRSRVDFVGVSGSDTGMDGTSPASQADLLNWVQRFNVQYPVAYDPSQNVATLYLQGGFPTMAIVGSNKKVAYLTSGETPFDELSAQLQKILH